MTHNVNFLPEDLQARILKAGFPEKDMIQHYDPNLYPEKEFHKKISWTAAMMWLNEKIEQGICFLSNGQGSVDMHNFSSFYYTIDHALKLIEEKQQYPPN